jgi:AMP nucleosidase
MTPEELAQKHKIARDMLTRYTGLMPDEFGKHILLTNFQAYLERFAALTNCCVKSGVTMPSATTSDGITMVNFGIGAPNAALIADMLGVVAPHALLLLGKCGGLNDHKRKVKIGDFILPTAAIRGDGTSDNYYPREVPALPSFQLHRVVAEEINKHSKTEVYDYHFGTVFTTNRRLWEHDEQFKSYLQLLRCIGIEMETAALFIAAFFNHIPHGALLLVSDMPLIEAKTRESDAACNALHTDTHIMVGYRALQRIKQEGVSVRYMK